MGPGFPTDQVRGLKAHGDAIRGVRHARRTPSCPPCLRGEFFSPSRCLVVHKIDRSPRPPRRVFSCPTEGPQMNPTQDTLDLVKGALATPDDRIGKTISASTGLLAFDLQMPAKNLYPFVTPLRNSIPRVGGGTGTATNWRQVTALLGSGFDAMGWVPEGQRSGQMSYTTASKSASFEI